MMLSIVDWWEMDPHVDNPGIMTTIVVNKVTLVTIIMANPNYLRPLVGRANRGLYAGKTIRYGNTISEMGNKTRRPWLPNVHPATLYSETLNRRISLKVMHAIFILVRLVRMH